MRVDDIRRIEIEIEKWTDVLAGYEQDFNLGVLLYNQTDAKCTLCPTYKTRLTRFKHGEVIIYYSCRRCPVVRITGRTCMHIRDENKFPPEWGADPEYAVEGVKLMIAELVKIKAEMQRINPQITQINTDFQRRQAALKDLV